MSDETENTQDDTPPMDTPFSNIGKVEIRQTDEDSPQYYFVALGRNGEPLVTSETYTRRATAEKQAGELFPGVEMVMADEDGT